MNCQICNEKPRFKKLTNARHLTGQYACKDCSATLTEHDNQSHLFEEETKVSHEKLLEGDLSYDDFKDLVQNKLGYELKDFYKEIKFSAGTPATTWKKKGVVPFLVKEYLKTKLNNIESKPKTTVEFKCVEFDSPDKNVLHMNDEELIQTVYAIKKGISSMFNKRKWNDPFRNDPKGKAKSFNKIRVMVKYLKRLHKYYDINNKPELELIHSTLIQIKDFNKFVKKYDPSGLWQVRGINRSFHPLIENYTTRDNSIWIDFGNNSSAYSYNDFLRYGRNKQGDKKNGYKFNEIPSQKILNKIRKK